MTANNHPILQSAARFHNRKFPMPELPEVESIRLALVPRLLGRTVAAVRIRRPDVINASSQGRRTPRKAPHRTHLLQGQSLTALHRHGKQLALVADTGRLLVIQLGMSGRLTLDSDAPTDHVHVEWTFAPTADDPHPLTLRFRDPRRFGALWTHPSLDDLHARRWAALGPDALADPKLLRRACESRLRASQRLLKAALLDQTLIAGLGNIYVDEALWHARLHPLTRCCEIDDRQARDLFTAISRVLREAVRHRGSTLRDYLLPDQTGGDFQNRHAAYGRENLPCGRCRTPMIAIRVAGRASTFCPHCQRGPKL